MMSFIGSKMVVAQFASDILTTFGLGWQSITITRTERYEVYSVSIVTDTLSGDIIEKLAQSYSNELTITSPGSIPDG